jgi:hypothetical protein
MKNDNSKEIANIIDNLITQANDKSINKTFRRGIVESVSGVYVNVYIEGSKTPTRNIIKLNSFSPAVGQKVLVLSIGDTGSNLLCIGSMGELAVDKIAVGNHVWRHYSSENGQVFGVGDSNLFMDTTASINGFTINGASVVVPQGGLYNMMIRLYCKDVAQPFRGYFDFVYPAGYVTTGQIGNSALYEHNLVVTVPVGGYITTNFMMWLPKGTTITPRISHRGNGNTRVGSANANYIKLDTMWSVYQVG